MIIKHYPKAVENNIGYFDYQRYLKEQDLIEKQIWQEIRSLQKTLQPNNSIWVLSNRWLPFVFGPNAPS